MKLAIIVDSKNISQLKEMADRFRWDKKYRFLAMAIDKATAEHGKAVMLKELK